MLTGVSPDSDISLSLFLSFSLFLFLSFSLSLSFLSFSRNFSKFPFAQKSQLGAMVSHAWTASQRREQRRRAGPRFAGRLCKMVASRVRAIARADARDGRLNGVCSAGTSLRAHRGSGRRCTRSTSDGRDRGK